VAEQFPRARQVSGGIEHRETDTAGTYGRTAHHVVEQRDRWGQQPVRNLDQPAVVCADGQQSPRQIRQLSRRRDEQGQRFIQESEKLLGQQERTEFGGQLPFQFDASP
jgi:hypothetical protein